ncbi:MAG: branched-chain amino acid ABC transporter permease [Alicyclobacillus sp.]|nr:branched-chain amino acid ABC transporter permease [Alicyclobacillus sp.]
MNGLLYYLLIAAVYFCIYCIYCWGINLQFGVAGILNFTFITFVAVGAYFAGVTALGAPDGGLSGQYILGWHLPFPIPPVLGGIAAAILAVLVGIVGLRRLRSDYLAIVTVSVGQIAWFIAGNNVHLFNGWDGISQVPQPWNSVFHLSFTNYGWVFLVICIVLAIIGYIVSQALYRSPYGRVLRAIRDDEDVAAALGKNVFAYKMSAFIIGSVFAGIGGALTVEFVGAFNPSGWTTPETFIIWAAMLIGGQGNNKGMILGAFVVPVVFNEITRFLPNIPGHPQLIDSFRGMAIGLLLILAVRFRPSGLLPERKTLFSLVPTVKGSEGDDRHVLQG